MSWHPDHDNRVAASRAEEDHSMGLSDASGDLVGMKGSGSLVGIITGDTIIDDIYTGTVR